MHINNEEEEYNLALSRFESMLKTNKVFFFDSEEFENIILHYLDTGRVNLANKALKLGVEQHPNSTGLKLVQVELFVFENKLDEAEKILKEIYAIEPTNEEIYIQQANIYSKKDKHLKAIECLQIALEYTDDYADVYSLLGMEYLYMDQLEQAKDNFLKCLKHDPEDHSALYNIIYCFDFLEQNKEAVVFLNEYINSNAYSEIAWHQLGRQYYQLKEYENAYRAFDYATLIDDSFIGAYLEKAKSLEKLKQYRDAIDAYKITLGLDDPTAYAYLRIGKCYQKLNELDEALDYFLKAVHEDPLLDKAWVSITNYYSNLGEYNKALEYLDKAISIDSENKNYWKKYGEINLALNLLEDAEKGYRRAVELNDYEISTWMLWIDLLLKTGSKDEALQTLLTAAEFFPGEHEVDYYLAGIYFTELNYELGEEHLIKGLTLNAAYIDEFYQNFENLIDNITIQRVIANFNFLKN
ncbi:tetratricopeptide repeat protein [Flavobacterium agricola]|uniref:Tetratricopeptide repeat protein n=1 Tax=Flavobacterium agricola TaxID=2870839 RepID=A0ABY6LXY0_9FLAO|nr:tetratricopeptide repeat protein [Flavobacterium agricola]UYW00402.1 tetratricopeptide repeat protein [Flavobacterium agricola]